MYKIKQGNDLRKKETVITHNLNPLPRDEVLQNLRASKLPRIPCFKILLACNKNVQRSASTLCI